LDERGDQVLQKYFEKLQWRIDDVQKNFKKFRWSVAGVEFIHSLLTRHIATHVCYCNDQGYGVADHPNRKMSKSLSSYML
jgi:hypothetical protein